MPVNPLVSIALCTYNGERFLSQQLDSILTQSYRNIEIVAVDDCSTDNTWNILQDYRTKDNRLQPYKNEHNLGHTLNFEKAMMMCKGEYIALSDQDDIWETDKIKCLIENISDAVLAYHDSDFIDEHNKRIGSNSMSSTHRMYAGGNCLPVILANCIHGHAMLFHSRLKDDLFPFDKEFSHDWAIAYAALNAGSIKYIDKVLVHYRQHPYAITDFLERRDGEAGADKVRGLGRLGVNSVWLRYCLNFKHKKDPAIANTACNLFLNLMNGRNKFKCFLFMIKYFDLLFYTMGNKDRRFISKVNFVRKLCYV